jgi:hypothetical protein
MKRVRETLARILQHHEPHPSMVLDRHWNILTKNKASAGIISRCVKEESLAELFPDGQLKFFASDV